MDITGTSIRTEPLILKRGKDMYYPTSMQRYITAKNETSRDKKTTYDLEKKNGHLTTAMATTESLQRTLANNPRGQISSNGIMTAPLISGMASDPMGSGHRQNEQKEGEDIMNYNTRIVEANTPKIPYI